MSSSGFGQWYEEQKAEESGEANSSWFGSGGDGDQVLPLWGDTSQLSFSSMKESMEAQMPQQVLGMNYQQRFKAFCALLFLSALFFGLAFTVGLPMIAVRPQKFALSFTFGSLMFMSSFGILKGPMPHLMSMIAVERLPFTTIYVGSMLATLYFTFTHGGASGYVLVMASSGCQLIALLWYLISFLPGGSAGLSYVLAAMGQILKPVMIACAKLQATCLQYCFSWMTR